MTAKPSSYIVEAVHYVLHMEGDRPEDAEDKCDPTEIYSGESYAEAKAAYDEALNDGFYAAHTNRQHGGLGSIDHWTIELYRLDFEDDEDDYGETAVLESFDSIPDRLQRAWDKAVRSYWKYLDYEEDGYLSLQSALDLESA